MADNVEEKEEEDFVPDDGGLLCDQHNTQIEEEVCEFESDNGGNADIRGEAIERDVRLQKRKEMKEQQRKQRADQQVRRDARQRLGREGQEEGEAEFAVVRGEASGEEGAKDTENDAEAKAAAAYAALSPDERLEADKARLVASFPLSPAKHKPGRNPRVRPTAVTECVQSALRDAVVSRGTMALRRSVVAASPRSQAFLFWLVQAMGEAKGGSAMHYKHGGWAALKRKFVRNAEHEDISREENEAVVSGLKHSLEKFGHSSRYRSRELKRDLLVKAVAASTAGADLAFAGKASRAKAKASDDRNDNDEESEDQSESDSDEEEEEEEEEDGGEDERSTSAIIIAAAMREFRVLSMLDGRRRRWAKREKPELQAALARERFITTESSERGLDQSSSSRSSFCRRHCHLVVLERTLAELEEGHLSGLREPGTPYHRTSSRLAMDIGRATAEGDGCMFGPLLLSLRHVDVAPYFFFDDESAQAVRSDGAKMGRTVAENYSKNANEGPHGFFLGRKEQRPFCAIEKLLLALLGVNGVTLLTLTARARRTTAPSPYPSAAAGLAMAKGGGIARTGAKGGGKTDVLPSVVAWWGARAVMQWRVILGVQGRVRFFLARIRVARKRRFYKAAVAIQTRARGYVARVAFAVAIVNDRLRVAATSVMGVTGTLLGGFNAFAGRTRGPVHLATNHAAVVTCLVRAMRGGVATFLQLGMAQPLISALLATLSPPATKGGSSASSSSKMAVDESALEELQEGIDERSREQEMRRAEEKAFDDEERWNSVQALYHRISGDPSGDSPPTRQAVFHYLESEDLPSREKDVDELLELLSSAYDSHRLELQALEHHATEEEEKAHEAEAKAVALAARHGWGPNHQEKNNTAKDQEEEKTSVTDEEEAARLIAEEEEAQRREMSRKANSEDWQENMMSLTFTLLEGRHLLAADKNGKSDPYGIIELVEQSDVAGAEPTALLGRGNGKAVEQPNGRGKLKLGSYEKHTTSTVRRTLFPKWTNEEDIEWEVPAAIELNADGTPLHSDAPDDVSVLSLGNPSVVSQGSEVGVGDEAGEGGGDVHAVVSVSDASAGAGVVGAAASSISGGSSVASGRSGRSTRSSADAQTMLFSKMALRVKLFDYDKGASNSDDPLGEKVIPLSEIFSMMPHDEVDEEEEEPEFEDDEEEERYMAEKRAKYLAKYEFWFELDKSIIGGGVGEGRRRPMPKISGDIKLRLMIQPPKGYVLPPPTGMRLLPPVLRPRRWRMSLLRAYPAAGALRTPSRSEEEEASSGPPNALERETPIGGMPGLEGSTGGASAASGQLEIVMPKLETVLDPPAWRLERRQPRQQVLDPSWKHEFQPPLSLEERKEHRATLLSTLKHVLADREGMSALLGESAPFHKDENSPPTNRQEAHKRVLNMSERLRGAVQHCDEMVAAKAKAQECYVGGGGGGGGGGGTLVPQSDPLPNALSTFLDKHNLSEAYDGLRRLVQSPSLGEVHAVGESAIVDKGVLSKVKARRLWMKLTALPAEDLVVRPKEPEVALPPVAVAEAEQHLDRAKEEVIQLQTEVAKARTAVEVAEAMQEQTSDDAQVRLRKKRQRLAIPRTLAKVWMAALREEDFSSCLRCMECLHVILKHGPVLARLEILADRPEVQKMTEAGGGGDWFSLETAGKDAPGASSEGGAAALAQCLVAMLSGLDPSTENMQRNAAVGAVRGGGWHRGGELVTARIGSATDRGVCLALDTLTELVRKQDRSLATVRGKGQQRRDNTRRSFGAERDVDAIRLALVRNTAVVPQLLGLLDVLASRRIGLAHPVKYASSRAIAPGFFGLPEVRHQSLYYGLEQESPHSDDRGALLSVGGCSTVALSRLANTDKTLAAARGVEHTSVIEDRHTRQMSSELRELRELRVEPQVLEKAAVLLWTLAEGPDCGYTIDVPLPRCEVHASTAVASKGAQVRREEATLEAKVRESLAPKKQYDARAAAAARAAERKENRHGTSKKGLRSEYEERQRLYNPNVDPRPSAEPTRIPHPGVEIRAIIHDRGAVATCLRLLQCSLWPLACRMGAVLVVSLARTSALKFDYMKAGILPLLHQLMLLGNRRIVVPAARVAVESFANLITAGGFTDDFRPVAPLFSPLRNEVADAGPAHEVSLVVKHNSVLLLEEDATSEESPFEFDVLLMSRTQQERQQERKMNVDGENTMLPLLSYLDLHNPSASGNLRRLTHERVRLWQELSAQSADYSDAVDVAITNPAEHAKDQQRRLLRLEAVETERQEKRMQESISAAVKDQRRLHLSVAGEQKKLMLHDNSEGHEQMERVNKEAERLMAQRQRMAALEMEIERCEKEALDASPLGLTLRRCRCLRHSRRGSNQGSSHRTVEALQVVDVATGSVAEVEGILPGDLVVAINSDIVEPDSFSDTLSKKVRSILRVGNTAESLQSPESSPEKDVSAATLVLTFERWYFKEVNDPVARRPEAEEEGSGEQSKVNVTKHVETAKPSPGILLDRSQMKIFADGWATGRPTMAFSRPQNTYFPLGLEEPRGTI